jgi:hypothetical protein
VNRVYLKRFAPTGERPYIAVIVNNGKLQLPIETLHRKSRSNSIVFGTVRAKKSG